MTDVPSTLFDRLVPVRFQRWLGPFIVLATGLILLRWSWLKWGDLLVDSGQQLYIGWQLSEGKTLYRDIAHNYGPLSPYTISIWFRLFGASMLTLAMSNLAVLALITTLLFGQLKSLSNAASATIACVAFLSIFGFPQLESIGGYNYILPYENSITLGMLYSLLTIECLRRFMQSQKQLWLFGIGGCLGLTFLTKPELFLALFTAIGFFFVLCFWSFESRKDIARQTSIVVGMALVPIAIAAGLLSLAMPFSAAVYGTLGSWPAIFTSGTPGLKLYQFGMGTDDIMLNVSLLINWFGTTGGVLLLPFAVSMFMQKTDQPSRRDTIVATLVGAAFLAWLGITYKTIDWYNFPCQIPIWLAILGVIEWLRWRKLPKTAAGKHELFRAVWILFSAVLLLKMILYVRFRNFGFVLAMPATCLCILAISHWIPEWLKSRKRTDVVFRTAALVSVAVTIWSHLWISNFFYSQKTIVVEHRGERFLTDSRAGYFRPMLLMIEESVPEDATLLSIPDGTMFNFLTRRENPTPIMNWLPMGFAVHGEPKILELLKESRPDYILLVHRDSSEFGFRFFGRDFGTNIATWIRQNYAPLPPVGAVPLQDERFGLMLLRRRADIGELKAPDR